MTISKIAELLLAICFLFLGSATVSAVVVGYCIFIFKFVYRFTEKESDNEDH